MGRRTSPDPKVRVSLSLRKSTVENLERLTPKDSTVGIELSKAVESKFGKDAKKTRLVVGGPRSVPVRDPAGRTVGVKRAEDFGSRLKGSKK